MSETCSCIKLDNISRLEADVMKINEKLEKHSDKFEKSRDTEIVLERTVAVLEGMREDSVENKNYIKQLTGTLSSIQTTMVETTCNMRELAKNQTETNLKINTMSTDYDQRFDETNKKIADTATKITIVDGKGKIDVVEVLAANWRGFLVGGVGIGAIIGLIEYLV